MTEHLEAENMPRNGVEWQEAVDCAHAMLHLDSAQKYGLLAGGPEVDVERCELLLELGSKLGFTPARRAIDQLAREIAGASPA